MNIWYTSQDLILVVNPPINAIYVGIPQSGAFANFWCQKDSSGVISLIGGGIDNFTYRSASVSLNTGVNVLTYSTPFAGGTNTTVVARCYNTIGNVDYRIFDITENGFKIEVPFGCSMDFETRIVNDVPIIV